MVILDNPLAESGDYRIAVLTCLMHLERLDKELVSSEERAEAQERLKVTQRFLVDFTEMATGGVCLTLLFSTL